jgi:hypothetical protein
MGGWMDGWMEGKAGIRIAYSNQKPITLDQVGLWFQRFEYEKLNPQKQDISFHFML